MANSDVARLTVSGYISEVSGKNSPRGARILKFTLVCGKYKPGKEQARFPYNCTAHGATAEALEKTGLVTVGAQVTIINGDLDLTIWNSEIKQELTIINPSDFLHTGQNKNTTPAVALPTVRPTAVAPQKPATQRADYDEDLGF